MKLTIYKKFVLDIDNYDIEELKENYMNTNEEYDNIDEKDVFDIIEENYDLLDYDDITVDEKQCKEFIEKWNNM
jgi:hypothetical protein